MGIVIFLIVIVNEIQLASCNKVEPDYYRYLQQFGYTPKLEGRRLSTVVGESAFNEAIKTFQRLYRLPETGLLDDKTKKLMQQARCGNPDLGTVNSVKRPLNIDVPEPARLSQGRSADLGAPQSYVTHTNFWPKKKLTWFIEDYPKQQTTLTSQDQIRRIMKQAFDDWEKHSALEFRMVNSKGEADLKIKFHSKDHGDGYPFDGKGSTLAHAFYPLSGEIHFDDDEHFNDQYTSITEQYNLRLVAAHEIGHALGLSHSFEEESLMFPVYQLFPQNYNLSNDDLQGIQTLYGKSDEKSRETSATVTTTPSAAGTTSKTSMHWSNSLPDDNWCAEDFQTGCEGPDRELYLFKDEQVWRYRARAKRSWENRPTSIKERFPALSDLSITACVRSTKGYTYLFRNYRMWKLKTHWLAEGPHVLQGKYFPQNPRAALLHQNAIYLIRNHVAYRLNENNYDEDLEIRKLDSILRPIPNEFIRSGFTYGRNHYIFTQSNVYVYNANDGTLLPGYPKPRVNGWFACEGATGYSDKVTRPTDRKKDRDRHRHHHHHDHDLDHDHQRRPVKRPFHRHRTD